MEIIELIRECINNLAVNKLRTGLAVLGIVIGIGSVIALLSIGQGSQQQVERQITSLGANLLTVMPGSQRTGVVRGAAGGGTTLTLEDAKALESAKLSTIKTVSPEFSQRSQVVAGRNNTNTQIIGVYPQYFQVRKIDIAQGSALSDFDISATSKVAVLGPQTAIDLFGEGFNPVGQSVRINGKSFKIIGTTQSKGGSGFNNPDDAIYVPLSTAQKQLFGVNYLSTIAIEAQSKEVMTQAQNDIGYFLLARHKIADPSSADFSIMSQNDILDTASQVTGTFTTLLGGIAAISLLVGGIGIMNIMFVTVTERTREIGLRKALGARKKLIITQFLIEAAILTLVGGILGMLLGVSISYLLSKALSFPFAVSPSSILLSIGVSGAIGLIFGWYPARKASQLPPIVALRYE